MDDVPAPRKPRRSGTTTRPIARARGLTLLELLVTLAVAAIVLTIGVPSFQSLMREFRATTVTNQLMAYIQHTRSEAIRRGMPVTLCASDDGATCMNSDPVDFSQGWIVVSGYPGDPGSEVLRVHKPDLDGIEIREGFGSSDHLSYASTGETRTSGGAFIAGKLQICHDGQDRRVIINKTGRARVAKQPCED